MGRTVLLGPGSEALTQIWLSCLGCTKPRRACSSTHFEAWISCNESSAQVRWQGQALLSFSLHVMLSCSTCLEEEGEQPRPGLSACNTGTTRVSPAERQPNNRPAAIRFSLSLSFTGQKNRTGKLPLHSITHSFTTFFLPSFLSPCARRGLL